MGTKTVDIHFFGLVRLSAANKTAKLFTENVVMPILKAGWDFRIHAHLWAGADASSHRTDVDKDAGVLTMSALRDHLSHLYDFYSLKIEDGPMPDMGVTNCTFPDGTVTPIALGGMFNMLTSMDRSNSLRPEGSDLVLFTRTDVLFEKPFDLLKLIEGLEDRTLFTAPWSNMSEFVGKTIKEVHLPLTRGNDIIFGGMPHDVSELLNSSMIIEEMASGDHPHTPEGCIIKVARELGFEIRVIDYLMGSGNWGLQRPNEAFYG